MKVRRPTFETISPGARLRGRPIGMERVPMPVEQRAAMQRVAADIFTDVSNSGYAFREALASIYLSGLHHGAEITKEDWMNNIELLATGLQQAHAEMRSAAERAGKDPRRNAHIVRVGFLAQAAQLIAEGRGDAAKGVLNNAISGE